MNLDGSEVLGRFVPKQRQFLRLLPLLLCVGRAEGHPSTDSLEVHIGREEFGLDALPEHVGEAPRAALRQWSPFAEKHGYRMHLTEDGRVLLLLRSKRAPKRELDLLTKTLALFDTTLPAPAEAADSGKVAKPASAPRNGPEAVSRDTAGGGTWTEDGAPPDTETAVLIQTEKSPEFQDVVSQAAAIEPYLEPWTGSARNMSGFVLERPLVAAWQENAPGMEEWDPQNELVHRLMRLLVLRRASQQPNWLTLGLAWYAEMEIRDSIYCMPYRDGFVGVGEHTSWKSRLKKLARKDEDGLAMRDLANWRRGTYDGYAALRAWGTVRYLAAAGDGVLGRILEDFRNLRNEKGIHRDGLTWQRITDYEVSAEDQDAVLQARAGATVFADLQQAFEKGR